jgi:DNA-binding response OmpR family regulator
MHTDAATRQHEEPKAPAPTSHAVARKPRVLVVEDDGHMRRLMAATLERCGYQVVEAEDGVDLLGWIGELMSNSTDTFDAIVSDVNLPDLTAIEVLAALRARDSQVPIILVTALDDERIHKQAYELGVSAVLKKPFDLDDLRKVVVRLAARDASRVHASER